MKLSTKANTTKMTLFAAVLLATCFFAGTANAQAFQGKFTLQHSVRWGEAVLGAGEYRLALDTGTVPAQAVITNAASGKNVAIVRSSISEDGKGNSALLIGRRGNQHVVYSFRVAELGQVFIYDPALAHRNGMSEADNTETVPVLDAKK
jgi:hypothetical protein